MFWSKLDNFSFFREGMAQDRLKSDDFKNVIHDAINRKTTVRESVTSRILRLQRNHKTLSSLFAALLLDEG